MSTLAEIEAAADALPPEQKQKLFLFLAARLRGEDASLPPPREFSREQIADWSADDETGPSPTTPLQALEALQKHLGLDGAQAAEWVNAVREARR